MTKVSTLGVLKNLPNIKTDIVKIGYLTYICDLAYQTSKQNNSKNIYKLLISSIEKIEDKVKMLGRYDECSNTNIERVFNLVYDVYNSKDFKEEDALDQIVIISDMQFDSAIEYVSGDYMSCYEIFKKKMDDKGYKTPEIVFWNVNSYGTVPVGKNEAGVKLISGSSKAIINLVSNIKSIDPMDMMNKTLLKYKFVEELA